MVNNKVSVIVICYKQAQFLNEALASVLTQTYTNWECIIVNDGSPDNTNEIAEQWCRRDNRFIHINKPNGGPSSARNAGLDIASGAYIQFLDADDYLDKRKFELSVNQLKAGGRIALYFQVFKFSPVRLPGIQNRHLILGLHILQKETILYKWDFGFFIPIHCGFYETGLFQDVRFPEHLKAKEDWVMWLMLFQKQLDVHFINLPLAFYRNHGQGMTKDPGHMEDNLIKTLFYIRQIMPIDEYEQYMTYFFETKAATYNTDGIPLMGI